MPRKTLSKQEKRDVRFNVYTNPREAAIILEKSKSAGMRPTDFLRTAGLGKHIRQIVPAVNLEKWKELKRLIDILDEIISNPDSHIKEKIEMSWFRVFRWEVQRLRLDIISEKPDDERDF